MSLSKMLCLILYHLSLIPIWQIGWSTLSWFPSQCLCKLTSQMISYRQVKSTDALGVWVFWCSVNVITKHHIRNTICIPWLSKMFNISLFLSHCLQRLTFASKFQTSLFSIFTMSMSPTLHQCCLKQPDLVPVNTFHRNSLWSKLQN